MGMPFSLTERKILVYNKMKRKGLSYDQAVKEVCDEMRQVKKNHKEEKQKEVEKPFKEKFMELKNGND